VEKNSSIELDFLLPQRLGRALADDQAIVTEKTPEFPDSQADGDLSAGIPEPRMVNGVPQKPIEGASMAYTFDDAKAPDARVAQYFEMFGNRALYHDRWVAECRHGKLPWQTSGSASSTQIPGSFTPSKRTSRRRTTLP
jgi:hypothetical protein